MERVPVIEPCGRILYTGKVARPFPAVAVHRISAGNGMGLPCGGEV